MGRRCCACRRSAAAAAASAVRSLHRLPRPALPALVLAAHHWAARPLPLLSLAPCSIMAVGGTCGPLVWSAPCASELGDSPRAGQLAELRAAAQAQHALPPLGFSVQPPPAAQEAEERAADAVPAAAPAAAPTADAAGDIEAALPPAPVAAAAAAAPPPQPKPRRQRSFDFSWLGRRWDRHESAPQQAAAAEAAAELGEAAGPAAAPPLRPAHGRSRSATAN